MARDIAGFGWVPDLPDHRDHLFAAAPEVMATLPTSVDLRPGCPPIYDQGHLGSCTGNAIAGALQFDQLKEKLAQTFVPARLFIYYNERTLEGTVNSDSGAMIRDGIKSVATLGACPETEWPYDITKFAEKPPQNCYADATNHPAIAYQRLLQDLNQMKGCLAAGYPFVFGFAVYESFRAPAVKSTGHAPMPAATETQVGGHAVVAVGYDDANQWWIVRNSWGTSWGMAGYFTLPYAYLTQQSLSGDFWTIRQVQ